MSVLPEHPSGWGPAVKGDCPACDGRHSLFLGSGGWVTCADLSCPQPDAASRVLAWHSWPVPDRGGQ